MLLTKSLILLAACAASASSIVEERATPGQPIGQAPSFGQYARACSVFVQKVNAWDGTLAGAIPIQNAEQDIEAAIKSITSSAQSQSTCSQITKTVNQANSIYAPDMAKVVNAIRSNEDRFTEAGLRGTIQMDLNSLRSLSSNLASVLLRKACPDSKKAAQQFAKKLNRIFNPPSIGDPTSSSSDIKRAPPQMPVRATEAQKQGIYTKYDKDIKALIQKVNQYDGTIAGAVPIGNAVQDLEKDLKSLNKTIHSFKSCTRISEAIKLARSILVPDLVQAVRALRGLESRDPTAKRWAQSLIEGLGGASERFGVELVKVACPPQRSAAQEVLEEIKRIFGDDDHFPPRPTGPANLKRTPAQVLALLKQLDADCRKAISLVNSWKGDVDGATPIQNALYECAKAVDAATAQAKKEPVASCADSQTIINYISNPLEPDISALVDAVIAKKAQFQAIGLYSTVKSDFAELKTKFTALTNAIIAAACSTLKSAATNAKNKLIGDINRGVAAYP